MCALPNERSVIGHTNTISPSCCRWLLWSCFCCCHTTNNWTCRYIMKSRQTLFRSGTVLSRSFDRAFCQKMVGAEAKGHTNKITKSGQLVHMIVEANRKSHLIRLDDHPNHLGANPSAAQPQPHESYIFLYLGFVSRSLRMSHCRNACSLSSAISCLACIIWRWCRMRPSRLRCRLVSRHSN